MPTQSEIEAFRRDGFVVVPDLLTEAELERYGAAVDAAVASRRAWDTRVLAEKSRYEQSFDQCINLWEDFEEVRPLTFHARIGETAATLLGVERLRLWHDQALYKDAGGRETDAHQDQPYWPMHETDAITAWIPFDGSTRAGGAMAYVPGSHRFGVRKFINIFGHDAPYDIIEGPESKGVAPVWVEVPRGAVAFHHSLTIHLAAANSLPRPRRVHTMIMFRDGSRRGKGFPHPSVDREGIEMDAAIDGTVTPVLWPLAGGALPPLPPRPPTLLWGWPPPLS